MTLDFHYQSASIVKYRTDVTFGWLDLMVSFGGIAGLFLGCSILSGVEIAYYIFIMLMMLWRKLQKPIETFLEKQSRRVKTDDGQNKFRKKAENVRVIKVQSLSEREGIDENKKGTRY